MGGALSWAHAPDGTQKAFIARPTMAFRNIFWSRARYLNVTLIPAG
jgi:hypothetical protein